MRFVVIGFVSMTFPAVYFITFVDCNLKSGFQMKVCLGFGGKEN